MQGSSSDGVPPAALGAGGAQRSAEAGVQAALPPPPFKALWRARWDWVGPAGIASGKSKRFVPFGPGPLSEPGFGSLAVKDSTPRRRQK